MTGMEFIVKLNDYEAVKDKLILRPLNYPDYSFELSDYVYKRVGDIALVLYGVIRDSKEEGLTTFRIPRGIMEKWGLPEDVVMDQALMMTSMKAPARIYFSPEELLESGENRGAFMSCAGAAPDIGKWDVPILTTTRRINGAIALFYPGVMDKLAKMYGNRNFYVVFTSIHEARLHCADSIPAAYMENSLAEINRTFERKEVLTRKIYLYNILERKLQLAAVHNLAA